MESGSCGGFAGIRGVSRRSLGQGVWAVAEAQGTGKRVV